MTKHRNIPPRLGTYDPKLDQYEGKTQFPEKLAKAEEVFRTKKLPEEFYEQEAKLTKNANAGKGQES